jgi:hypothetical protein
MRVRFIWQFHFSVGCRPLRGLNAIFVRLTWGLRPRLYSAARFAGSAP